VNTLIAGGFIEPLTHLTWYSVCRERDQLEKLRAGVGYPVSHQRVGPDNWEAVSQELQRRVVGRPSSEGEEEEQEEEEKGLSALVLDDLQSFIERSPGGLLASYGRERERGGGCLA